MAIECYFISFNPFTATLFIFLSVSNFSHTHSSTLRSFVRSCLYSAQFHSHNPIILAITMNRNQKFSSPSHFHPLRTHALTLLSIKRKLWNRCVDKYKMSYCITNRIIWYQLKVEMKLKKPLLKSIFDRPIFGAFYSFFFALIEC